MSEQQTSNPTDGARLLLPEKIRRRLEALTLNPRKIRAGALQGERRSVKRGTSIEFADYRDYTPGDDLRRLDWNVYARLGKPYVKLFEDEEDLAVHLILDTSASMNWPPEGERAGEKLLFAKRIFAALAYISLASNDALMLTAVNDFDGMKHFGPVRGRGHVVNMLRFVHNLEAKGLTAATATLEDYALRFKRAGMVIFISDMFSPDGWLEGLNRLLANGHEVAIVHVLTPEEVMPPLAGDLRLVDIETGEAREVTVDATLRDIYHRRLEAWRNQLRTECARRGAYYLPLQSDMVWERVLLHDMRRLGIVK